MGKDREINGFNNDRRNFIKGVVATTAAVAISSITHQEVGANNKEGGYTSHEMVVGFDGGIENILKKVKQNGKIESEFFSSGIYAQKEHELLDKGLIKPFSPYVYSTVRNCNFEQGRVDDNVTSVFMIDVFDQKKSPIPVEISDFSLTEIDGKEHLVMGAKYMNIDGTCGFLHYAIQNFEDEKTKKIIDEMLQGYYAIYPIKTMDKIPESNYFDYSKEGVMLDRYRYQNPETINKIFDSWTGPEVIHRDIESTFLLPFIYP